MFKQLSIKTIIASLLILLVIGCGGYWWFSKGQYIQSTDNAYIHADKTTISSKLPGFLDAGWIRDNQQVIEGAELARIDPDDYTANLKLAQSQTAAAQAEMMRVRAQLVLQDSLIQEARAVIAADQASLKQSMDDVSRYQHLSGAGYSARRKLESAIVAKEAAQAKLTQAQAELDSQQKQKQVLQALLQQAVATINAKEASLEKAQADMDKVVIRAPDNGIIAQRLAQNGEYVGAGTPLFTLMDMSNIWVVANFKETQISNIKPGQPVSVDVDSFSGQPLTGYVQSLSPGSGAEFSVLPPQNATGNFTKIVQRIPVKIIIPGHQALAGKLRPGMSVTVSINTQDESVDLSMLTTTNNNVAAIPGEVHHG